MATKKTVKEVKEVVVADVSNVPVIGEGMKVIFADVKVRGLSMNKQDKGLSNEINAKNNAETGTAHVTLRKFPESFCKPITNAGQGVYQVYKQYGIVVVDHYAIPIVTFPKFYAALREAKSKFELHVSALRDAVQTGALSEISKVQQGNLYNSDNDLTVDEVDRCFVVQDTTWLNMQCKGIKDAMNILGAEMVAHLEAEHVKALELAKKTSELAGAQRVADGVQEMVQEILKNCQKQDIKGVQWKTLIKNIQEAIETLPNFNVTNNPKITEGLELMKVKLGTVKEYELKNDELKRKELATGATEIASAFAKMF